jgi:hypothetical protein
MNKLLLGLPFFFILNLTFGQTTTSNYVFFNENRTPLQARNWVIRQNNSNEGDLQFGFINSNTGGLPNFFATPSDAKLTISNTGNVGIGTTTPSAKLDVQGNANFNGNVLLGKDFGGVSTISGPAFSGAIQIKTHSALGGSANRYLRLGVKDNNSVFYPVISINDDQNVGIGTTTTDSKLCVKGTIHTNEVKVDLLGAVAPDYVFENSYKLPTLFELQSYINQNKHLPEVPSAKEMEENGINLKEMNLLLLKKVEELTLYVLEQNRKTGSQQNEIEELRNEIRKMKQK